MGPAGTYNILTDQGKTFLRTLFYGAGSGDDFVPLDNTGFSARMQVRKTIPSEDVVLDLSTSGGDIVLGGSDGSIVIEVDAASMSALNGVYRYDLELVDSSGSDDVVFGVVRGEFKVRPEVTR
jgi:hypothetical protein